MSYIKLPWVGHGPYKDMNVLQKANQTKAQVFQAISLRECVCVFTFLGWIRPSFPLGKLGSLSSFQVTYILKVELYNMKVSKKKFKVLTKLCLYIIFKLVLTGLVNLDYFYLFRFQLLFFYFVIWYFYYLVWQKYLWSALVKENLINHLGSSFTIVKTFSLPDTLFTFLLSAFLRNFFLCQDCWYSDVPSLLVQHCCLALGWVLDLGLISRLLIVFTNPKTWVRSLMHYFFNFHISFSFHHTILCIL